MSHANATLTPITRLRLARLVVEGGWTYAAAAKMFMVSPRTAKKWADRYRLEGPGRDGRPDLTPAPLPIEDTHQDRAAHRGAAVAAPPGPGPDRRPARHPTFDRARGAAQVPDQPALAHRPGHR